MGREGPTWLPATLLGPAPKRGSPGRAQALPAPMREGPEQEGDRKERLCLLVPSTAFPRVPASYCCFSALGQGDSVRLKKQFRKTGVLGWEGHLSSFDKRMLKRSQWRSSREGLGRELTLEGSFLRGVWGLAISTQKAKIGPSGEGGVGAQNWGQRDCLLVHYPPCTQNIPRPWQESLQGR